MCFFKKRKEFKNSNRINDITQKLITDLKSNGVEPCSIEFVVNRYGVNNKEFEMITYFNSVVFVSNDIISYCGYTMNSHIEIKYTVMDESLVNIDYLFVFVFYH